MSCHGYDCSSSSTVAVDWSSLWRDIALNRSFLLRRTCATRGDCDDSVERELTDSLVLEGSRAVTRAARRRASARGGRGARRAVLAAAAAAGGRPEQAPVTAVRQRRVRPAFVKSNWLPVALYGQLRTVDRTRTLSARSSLPIRRVACCGHCRFSVELRHSDG